MKYFLLISKLLFCIVAPPQIVSSQSNPLIEAFKKSDYKLVRELAENPKYINLADPATNMTPLFYAIIKAGSDSTDYLTYEKKSFYYTENKSAGFRKYKEEMYQLVNLLLDKGAVMSRFDKNGRSPLFYAISFKDSIIVNNLLARNVKIEDSDVLLELASMYDFRAVVSALLNNKLNPCHINHKGFAPIHLAAMNDKSNIINLFIEHKINVNCKTGIESGYFSELTALQLACIFGHDDIVMQLINGGASTDLEMKDGTNLLHLASKGARFEPMNYSKNGKPEGEVIVDGGNLQIVRLITSVNPDLHDVDSIGANPLHWACYYRKIETAKELILLGEKAVKVEKNADHIFASALSHFLVSISSTDDSSEKGKYTYIAEILANAKEKYKDSLVIINNKMLGRTLLNASTVALAGAAAAYQAQVYSNMYGYGYSQVEYPVIQSDDLAVIKKYLKAQIILCDNWLNLLETISTISSSETILEELVKVLNLANLMKE